MVISEGRYHRGLKMCIQQEDEYSTQTVPHSYALLLLRQSVLYPSLDSNLLCSQTASPASTFQVLKLRVCEPARAYAELGTELSVPCMLGMCSPG